MRVPESLHDISRSTLITAMNHARKGEVEIADRKLSESHSYAKSHARRLELEGKKQEAEIYVKDHQRAMELVRRFYPEKSGQEVEKSTKKDEPKEPKGAPDTKKQGETPFFMSMAPKVAVAKSMLERLGTRKSLAPEHREGAVVRVNSPGKPFHGRLGVVKKSDLANQVLLQVGGARDVAYVAPGEVALSRPTSAIERAVVSIYMVERALRPNFSRS